MNLKDIIEQFLQEEAARKKYLDWANHFGSVLEILAYLEQAIDRTTEIRKNEDGNIALLGPSFIVSIDGVLSVLAIIEPANCGFLLSRLPDHLRVKLMALILGSAKDE